MSTAHIDVMISSTRKDLETHRKQVEDAILRLSMFPVGMERMPAADSDAITESLHMVDISEVYLGIFGMRYGFIPNDPRNPEKISITEMEYRLAVERDIPILIFIMDDEHPLTAKDVETDPEKHAKLSALKADLMDEHIVAKFKSSEDLRYIAIQSLQRVKDEAAARSGENDAEQLIDPEDELVRPPDLLALPPYILTQNFIGRKTELALLDDWSQSDNAIMVVDAIGGMGKSALTWEWARQEQQKSDFEARFWFSFYEGGTNMMSFLLEAAAYLTEQHPDKLRTSNRGDLEKELQRILNTKRVLLVLDGLERVLVAYHRIDASQIRDDEVEDSDNEEDNKKKHTRSATDPKDGRFLKILAGMKKGKVLLSTRLMPKSLEASKNKPILGVRHQKLGGLHPDDAYHLMLDRGVIPSQDPKLMDEFMAQFGYHGLLLNITAGSIMDSAVANGQFDVWYNVYGKDLNDPNVNQARLKLLNNAFTGLSETAQEFLSRIAAFSDAIPYNTLSVFNPFGKQPPKYIAEPDLESLERYQQWKADGDDDWDNEIEKLSKQKDDYEAYLQEKEAYETYLKTPAYFDALAQFDNLLNELTDRGLLNWERDKNSYDLHPVVCGYCFDQLDGEEKIATFDKIHNHFEQRPVNYDTALSVADLYNAIMVYRALVGAGKLEVAANFYRGTGYALTEALLYALNSTHLIIQLLTPLFADGLDKLPSFTDDRLKGYMTNELAMVFWRAGDIEQALPLRRLNIELELKRKDTENLSTNIRNHAEALRTNNQIQLAIRAMQLGLELSLLDEDDSMISLSHAYLLRYHSLMGDWQEADKHDNILGDDEYEVGDTSFYRAEKAFYMGEDASQALDSAWQKITDSRNLQ